MDEEIRKFANLGYNAKSIAHLLGMNEQVIRRKLGQLGFDPRSLTVDWKYGFSRESFNLRAGLGGVINDMIERHGFLTRRISAATGLNEREIGVARSFPFEHDWTISQMERTASYVGKTIHDFI